MEEDQTSNPATTSDFRSHPYQTAEMGPVIVVSSGSLPYARRSQRLSWSRWRSVGTLGRRWDAPKTITELG